jgi:uncharacterized membrane protein
VLDVDSTTVRLALHLLGVCVWIGGQIVLAGIVPVLAGFGQDAVAAAARRFQWIAWSGFAVAFVTGIWNIYEVDLEDRSDEYLGTFGLKMTMVTLSGLFAAGHVVAASRLRAARASGGTRSEAPLRAALGVAGGLGLLTALAAGFCGVQMRS